MSHRTLSESSLRYLCYIYRQMERGANGEITLVLHEGGVRDCRESLSIRARDLEPSDPGMVSEIQRVG